MKRPLVALVACLLLGLTPHSPVFVARDAAQPIVVRAGEEFFIALPSNASTGYAWSQHLGNAAIAAYEGNVYEPAQSTAIGAPGSQLFIYHANRTGTTTIELEYTRSFDPNAPAAKSLTFTLTVE